MFSKNLVTKSGHPNHSSLLRGIKSLFLSQIRATETGVQVDPNSMFQHGNGSTRLSKWQNKRNYKSMDL